MPTVRKKCVYGVIKLEGTLSPSYVLFLFSLLSYGWEAEKASSWLPVGDCKAFVFLSSENTLSHLFLQPWTCHFLDLSLLLLPQEPLKTPIVEMTSFPL